MVTCPKCSASLPDWAQKCQFCGTDVRAVVRPVAQERKKYTREVPKGVWIAYYCVSVYFMLSGVLNIISSISQTSRKDIFGDPQGFSLPIIVGIIFGALTVLVGLGLMLRVEIARGIVNFICGMKILCGLAGAGFTIFGAMVTGPFGILMMFLQVFDIVTAGLMIYLIGETEKSAPNL